MLAHLAAEIQPICWGQQAAQSGSWAAWQLLTILRHSLTLSCQTFMP